MKKASNQKLSMLAGLALGAATFFVSSSCLAQACSIEQVYNYCHFIDVSYNDAKFGEEACKVANRMRETGITQGCQSDPPAFCPHCTLTRQEAAIFVARALNYDKSYTINENGYCSGDVYKDVKPGTPFENTACTVIEQLTARNALEGVGNAYFHPKNNATRAEAAGFIARALLPDYDKYWGYPTSFPGDIPTAQNKAENWYYSNVEALARNCITKGCTETKYCPSREVTRMEFAIMLMTAIKQHKRPGPDACQPVKECSNNYHCESGLVCVNYNCQECDPKKYYPICKGNKVGECESNGYYSYTSCNPDICMEGVGCVECEEPGERICNEYNNAVLECTNYYEYKKIQSCGYQEVCKNAKCVSTAECNENEPAQCEGELLKICKNGKYTTEQCSTGKTCINGQCQSTSPTCSVYDPPICLNEKLALVCENGNQVKKECYSGETCINGICTNNEACDPNEPAYCEENVRVFCNNGTLERHFCKAGEFCQNGNCMTEGVMYDECDPKTFIDECARGQRVSCGHNGKLVAEYCAEGLRCEDGQCVSAAVECDGYPRCKDDKTLEYCDERNVVDSKVCPGICINGRCAECDPKNATYSCYGIGAERICVNYAYQTTTCELTGRCDPNTGRCESECNASFDPVCEGNSIKTCSDSGLFEYHDCEDLTCINGLCLKESDKQDDKPGDGNQDGDESGDKTSGGDGNQDGDESGDKTSGGDGTGSKPSTSFDEVNNAIDNDHVETACSATPLSSPKNGLFAILLGALTSLVVLRRRKTHTRP